MNDAIACEIPSRGSNFITNGPNFFLLSLISHRTGNTVRHAGPVPRTVTWRTCENLENNSYAVRVNAVRPKGRRRRSPAETSRDRGSVRPLNFGRSETLYD